ncbi:MAG: hypothetical protein LBM93_10625 [Oscillospiraceae bacterium]|jgi:hypothetical protein|nr:hypothetical protein [Oscillospiraceae bacterium]
MAKKFLAFIMCLVCMVGLAVPVSAEQSFVTFGAETINLNVDLNRSGSTITYTGSASGTNIIGILFKNDVPVDSKSTSLTGSYIYVTDTYTSGTSGIYRVQLEGNVALSTGSETVYKSKTKAL